MAQQDIDIGVEGNDGTGDSIRESFRKTNENFTELYGAFDEGGRITFRALDDTPDTLLPNHVPFVNSDGTFLNLVEFGSNSDLDENEDDTIFFDYSVPGKIVISNVFKKLSDDQKPTLDAPLNAAGNGIANVSITQGAVERFNTEYTDTDDISIDDLVITKGYADQRYVSSENLRIDSEPTSVDQYTLKIESYTDSGNLLIPGHGLIRAVNGTPYVFESRYDVPEELENGETYFIRVVNSDQISLFDNRDDANLISDSEANSRKIAINAIIRDDGLHTITDAAFDPDLPGNFLSDVALPRESIVRRQGDNMEGDLFLEDHPGDLSGFGVINGEDDLQAATKLYVDNSAYSSPENLFVSTFGDDTMVGVPQGREGTALAYAFRTIGEAARRAAEIIETSPAEPGPYFQTITGDNREFDATVLEADVIAPQNEQTRNLIDQNTDFLVREALAFLDTRYPNLEYDSDLYRSSYERIIKSIAYDVNRARDANSLTRLAALTFFNSINGRIAISRQLTENLSAIDFLKDSTERVLLNQLYQQKSIQSITSPGEDSVVNEQARIATNQLHNFSNGDQIFFKDVNGMTELNGLTAYVRNIETDDSNLEGKLLELYTDAELENLWDISGFSDHEANSGVIGLVFQDRIQDFDSIKVTQSFDDPDVDINNRNAIDDKFELVKNILVQGIDEGTGIIPGNNYQIALGLDTKDDIDQIQDTLPNKIVVGKLSGAQGRIVNITRDSINGQNVNRIELEQLTPSDFRIGEAVEFGNFVKQKQVTIRIESGTYEEDLPIKLSANVSLKGDEFRRVIIRPKRRTSQSIWADTYFYRDLEFDDISILEKKHSAVSEIGSSNLATSPSIKVDDISWISENLPVKFIGNNLIGSELEKNTIYYVQNIDESTLEIQVSETEEGTPIEFANESGEMYVIEAKVGGFLNQTNDVQGYFGRHYLRDPYSPKNVGQEVDNPGGFDVAAAILIANISYIQQEVIAFITNQITAANSENNTDSIWFGFQYNESQYLENTRRLIESLARDFERGGTEFTLEVQGFYDLVTGEQERDQTDSVIIEINTLLASLLRGNQPSQSGEVKPDTSKGQVSEDTVIRLSSLVAVVRFAFNDSYNPPKRNDDDGVDVFMMGDATILRNVTVQGHGGFMIVLDPDGQILTKSPYIQTGSSFSKSDNEKRFRGGMFVDAFVGNIPARITSIENAFELEIESNDGEGLAIRTPQLPCPFYLDGQRYQVNALSRISQRRATIFLDANSNQDSDFQGQGYLGDTGQEIFLQTAGNRSMLGNDFTQINDLGYGLVTTNGAFSEMVSMFTYYCQVAYYAKNGSEIRSLNGSNGYGNFGLVAEGADPNEIPDRVTLKNPMSQPGKAYTTNEFPNLQGDSFLFVYDFEFPPTAESIVTIDHGPSIGVLDYRISSVENFSDTDNDGDIGEEPDDVVAGDSVVSGNVYRLNIIADTENAQNFFGSLQADLPNNAFINYRNNRTHVFQDLSTPLNKLTNTPSTAINFDESTEFTYRTLSFSGSDAFSVDLPTGEVLSVVDVNFQFINLEVDISALSEGFGLTQGDTKIPIQPLANDDEIERLLRDIEGRQPNDGADYEGGMIFSYAGKTHQIVDYQTDSTVPYIEITDVNADLSESGTVGLSQGIPNTHERTFRAGLPSGSKAEITQAISLLRATGHDFTQIGTGGYNDSNYPNVILGEPNNDPDEAAQVEERRKGRVFFVSTDEDGFFRVGKFFTVNQGTGDIEFSGGIGLTGANSLGFKRGVTINEFSADSTFSDNSSDAVPTERATASYIDRVLGFNVSSGAVLDSPDDGGTRIGPGFLPLTGGNGMEGPLDMNGNSLENLPLPGSASDAASKSYVDASIQAYDAIEDLRNLEVNTIKKNDIILATGKKKIFVEPVIGGPWQVNDNIESQSGFKQGKIVDIEERNDEIEGSRQIVTYSPLLRLILSGNVSVSEGEILTQEETGANGMVSRNLSGTDVITLEAFSREDDWDTDNSYTLTGTSSGELSATVDEVSFADFQDEDTVTNGLASTTITDGPFDEIAHAAENESSVINLNIERQEDEVTYDLQIQDDSVTNADINSSAGILQSKLDMQKAVLFPESNEISGWDSETKVQSDLGLASFSDENFEIDEGYVRIKEGGIVYTEIQDIPEQTVLGRSDSGTGNLTSVSFSTVISDGGGLADDDFTNTIDREDENFPGDVLVKLDTGSYGVTPISEDVGSNTIARRRDNGFLDAQGYRIGGSDIATVSGSEFRLQTPGGARILQAEGNTTGSLVTGFPGNVDIGLTSISSESNFQAGSGFAGEGWLAVDWMYTNFIEAAGERDGNSTGISIGGLPPDPGVVSGTGFANSGPNVIDFVTNGGEKLVIDADTIRILDDLVIGADSDDSITFNARIGSNVLPDVNSSRNIGANGSRFNTVYADVFNGVATEAKYADLAENYQADNNYDIGTVVIFGGDKEVTVTDRKGDRRIAGIVSENPAYLMNSDLQEKNTVPIALQGRVQCKVLGRVEKGDLLVSSAIPEYAVVDNDPRVGAVIGKALQDKTTDGKDTVEVVVGRV
jgi:hypothetical protein